MLWNALYYCALLIPVLCDAKVYMSVSTDDNTHGYRCIHTAQGEFSAYIDCLVNVNII